VRWSRSWPAVSERECQYNISTNLGDVRTRPIREDLHNILNDCLQNRGGGTRDDAHFPFWNPAAFGNDSGLDYNYTIDTSTP
jgi:hypothetical protein